MHYICIIWDFPGSPVVKILPSNVGGAGSISDRVANKNPTCLAAKNRSRVVTNSIKTKILKKKKKISLLKKKAFQRRIKCKNVDTYIYLHVPIHGNS